MAGEGVFMKVVSCRWGLDSFTATLLEMGEAFGEGVMMAEESSDLVDSRFAAAGLGGVIFLKPLEVYPEKNKNKKIIVK